ncbi:MAG: patatin-like phospholipase family protein [Acidobacteriota bacterium]
MRISKGLRVGLALGGGAARGLAHVGVLKFLQAEGIPLHALAGVSVGSVIAAGYATGLSVERLVELAETVTWRDVGGWSFSVKGFNSNERMEQWLEKVLPVSTFEELRMPLRIMATDLHTGRPVILEKGDLHSAIRASCAIPGLYVPVELNGCLLADGYLTCNLPIRQVRELGVDVVIASAIGLEISPDVKLNNIYQILMRSFSIMSAAAQRYNYGDADVVIHPEVESYSWTEIESAGELIKAGELAARSIAPELERALNPSLWTRLPWNPFRREKKQLQVS